MSPSDPTTSLPNTQKGAYAWYRGGNNNIGPAGNANIFGTLWNPPVYTVTNGVTRTGLSGNLPAFPYLGTTVDLSGFFGIGQNNYFASVNNPPLAMLHLQGSNNTPFNDGQYRTWMRTGAFMRENSDAMYVGLKEEGFNQSDAVVNWSDDGGTDNLRFIFTSTLLGLPGAVNPLQGNSSNGYEFMRMSSAGPINQAGFGAGHVGIGPLFTNAKTPQNRVHINDESGLPTFMQISNIAGAGRPGTGQTGNDGLKLGIENLPGQNYQTAFLQWQENTPFIVQSDYHGTPLNGFIQLVR